MFEIEKTFTFEAGHALHHHDGHCRQPHGHSYILTIHIHSESLIADGPKRNMVIDFADISAVVNPMVDRYFDHRWLNETLETDSPTVEYMSKWIYDFLKPLLPGLVAVSLNETATSKVTYTPIPNVIQNLAF